MTAKQGIETPGAADSELVDVLRFSNHADPNFCICGHSWGVHPFAGQRIGPVGASCLTDGGCQACECGEWVYDFDNPQNARMRRRRVPSEPTAGRRPGMLGRWR